MSQRVRVVCGLISVAALGFMVFYFAKIIQVSVWEDTPKWSRWLWVYANFFLSLSVLFWLVRDYQQFVHGMPSRTLSAERHASLRQAILDGDIVDAVKLYRRTLPDVSLAEADNYIRRLADELMSKNPEKFKPLKLWDLNWRLMGVCVVVEFCVFAGFWVMMPPVSPVARLSAVAAGFLLGAGIFYSMRLKSSRKRTLCGVLSLVPAGLAVPLFSDGAYFGGLAFGACMILSGFTRKRPKFTRTNRPPSDVSPPP